jgi:hypothetical protein
MATKDHNGKASSMRKGGQPQQGKMGKESRNSSSMNNNNSCMTDMEQQESSNKGKGPSGENL